MMRSQWRSIGLEPPTTSGRVKVVELDVFCADAALTHVNRIALLPMLMRAGA